MKKLSKIYKELLEGIEYQNISDDDEYWDRVKVVVADNTGNEVGYAILDMYINETEFGNMGGGEGEYSDEEFDEHFPNGGAAKIEHLEIYREYRRKGYAKLLMDAVVKYVKSRGENTIYLIASPIGFSIDLESLSNFYKKYGFKIVKDFGNAHDMVAQLESVKEELTYRHSNTKGEEDDEYQIGMVVNENVDGNYGYHVGDLKEKSEFIGDKAFGARMLASTGMGKASKTGQFGAGYFFFGSLEQANEFTKTKNMPIYKVDFSKYNLYRPSNPKEFVESIISLTNALIMVPKNYTEDQEFISLINDLSEDLPYFGINLSKNKIYEITKGFVFDVTTGSNGQGDYLITRYLKASGYEGIDLRGTPYDSFFIGSVIYNIKLDSISVV